MFREYIKSFKRKKFYHDIIESLIKALEAKDVYTKGHSDRVAKMAEDMCKELGIRGRKRETIHIAAHLHDIGKIGIPDGILNKTGKLTDAEWEKIKLHPTIGCDILGNSKELKEISKIVLHHHERWDGRGYPMGIKEKEIPMGSRIIAICDAIDAITSKRAYKEPMGWEFCISEIEKNLSVMFDPIFGKAALKLIPLWSQEIKKSPKAV
ncbi:HD-GYP domain-containing protein [Tepidibacter hydrothermalis]|uniref:HD domain-containing protein n=1 Tax=Tepidibacter hydrothermalis TaxID=3036126 RepID=A0ABY8EAZ3_9FIRM|nr:HD domain-containing phosphohydrolase [Tepidibacter hydrothermalis]WFD10083.1 HD domain-containing protein [Tepidibacter hydrothermalis]